MLTATVNYADIDECATNNGGCGTTTCFNTVGSYSCGKAVSCPPGYIRDGNKCVGKSAYKHTIRLGIFVFRYKLPNCKKFVVRILKNVEGRKTRHKALNKQEPRCR